MQKVTLRTEIVGKKFISTHSLTHQDGKFYKHYLFKACLRRNSRVVKTESPGFAGAFFMIIPPPPQESF
ncbi:hypothetical protein [Klebsiella quasipneumoniae]|uniref:hypothetical protein n=1 Tax=Klebsiella quasipneumoniae TaxID=1463165 RepID=UPI003F6E251A